MRTGRRARTISKRRSRWRTMTRTKRRTTTRTKIRSRWRTTMTMMTIRTKSSRRTRTTTTTRMKRRSRWRTTTTMTMTTRTEHLMGKESLSACSRDEGCLCCSGRKNASDPDVVGGGHEIVSSYH